ncbi:Uncharacterised protein [Porphyromonas cangingivalis]|uniref:Uncharacterized protein n=1 Tax=Porphyromonas cangingivalis TaxID=36874 RepID=A0A1T4MCB0_PORCN|nr:hypothetical protein SAMN02745205_01463 [Porphyromonas cangingivalis]VEJ03116.1 Uncharacterised protein [Porphyromonas cangingivalis]
MTKVLRIDETSLTTFFVPLFVTQSFILLSKPLYPYFSYLSTRNGVQGHTDTKG